VAVPVGAQAEVSVYGHVHNGVVSKSFEGDSKGTATDVNANGSRFGFRAGGDLGNGLSALAHLELGVGTDSSATGTSTRHGYVGLSGGFGRVTVGQQSGAFHTTVHVDQSIWNAGIDGISPGSRTPNTIKYSNAVGPLSIQADLRLSDRKEANGPTGDGGAIGLSAAVTDSLTLTVAYDTDDSTHISWKDDEDAMHTGKETDFVGVSGKVSFGQFWGSLAWVQKDQTDHDGRKNVVTDYSQLWAGVHVTDATQLVAGYGQSEIDAPNAKTPSATTFGVLHDFGGGLNLWYEGKATDDDDPGNDAEGGVEMLNQIGLRYIF